MGIGQGACDA